MKRVISSQEVSQALLSARGAKIDWRQVLTLRDVEAITFLPQWPTLWRSQPTLVAPGTHKRHSSGQKEAKAAATEPRRQPS
ncbi:hypothetical protein WJX73_001294 [Symbiochloris irregularis]|uniref:Uncharacterized protein n=1 Tax=Symbiochloris irregularis TaxID=706552 RepID=A0AAW1P5B0_9CHLO